MSRMTAFAGQYLLLRLEGVSVFRKEFMTRPPSATPVHVPDGTILSVESIGQYTGTAALSAPDRHGCRQAVVVRHPALALRFVNGATIPVDDIGAAYVRVLRVGAGT